MAHLKLDDRQIVLLLQGGGALGAFQVGAWKALAERCGIDWVGGISIGAINAAVIAGHKGQNAADELESLWAEILSFSFPPFDNTEWLRGLEPWLPPSPLRALRAKYADWAWMAFPGGQHHFFTSRVLNPLLNPWCLGWIRKLRREELGFYDTAPLRNTLDQHVNWKSVGQPGGTRLCLGATRLRDGEVVFFDSAEGPISVDHVMASGALPPAFPPIEIKGEWYVDGGVSSNTPIEGLHDKICADAGSDTLVILLDLWDRKCDTMPVTMDDVLWRMKSIQYGSRKQAAERVVRHHWDRAQLKPSHHARLEICQLMLESDSCDPQFCLSDADFSRESFERLKTQGYRDMHRALDQAEPVHALSHKPAILYRYGAQHKHRQTDKYLAE